MRLRTIGLLCLLASPALAQLKLPALSPEAKVVQTAGLTTITIDYSSPAVKGRKIWGALVPMDKVWRAGANHSTTITFTQPVTIGDKDLAAGTYGFFAIVIALLSWMYLGAQLTLVAVEANVVGVHRLWPRSITQPPLTRGDRATFGRLARMEQRRPEYEVRMAVTPAADDDPLRDEADARDDADGSELGDDERGPAPLSPTPR